MSWFVADNGRVTDATTLADVYWRAGCPFCFRLRQALIWARIPVSWHDIWADEQAAAYVRSAALGNETVPTVVVGGRTYVNPAPGDLLRLIEQAHPGGRRWNSPLAAWRDFRRQRRG